MFGLTFIEQRITTYEQQQRRFFTPAYQQLRGRPGGALGTELKLLVHAFLLRYQIGATPIRGPSAVLPVKTGVFITSSAATAASPMAPTTSPWAALRSRANDSPRSRSKVLSAYMGDVRAH